MFIHKHFVGHLLLNGQQYAYVNNVQMNLNLGGLL